MNNTNYDLVTGDQFSKNNNEINHITINYVDDSTSIISSNNHEFLKKYCEQYYNLLKHYHNINYLKINADKTKFMIVTRPKYRNDIRNMEIK